MTELKPKEFKIIITGSADYDPDWKAENEKYVIDFQQVANVLFRKHRKELENLFNDLSPIKTNSAYNKNFYFREVDVEA